MKLTRFSTRTIVLYALFIALIFILGLTPLGLIPLGFINVTILCIPTIIGTILLGKKAGLVFGFFFGMASFLSAIGLSLVPPSGLASLLFGTNFFYGLLMCFVPRLIVPLVTNMVYSFFEKRSRQKTGIIAAAICGSLTNTILYLGLMLLFYTLCSLDSTSVVAIITGAGIVAGVSEAIAAAIIATPTVVALKALVKKQEGR